MASVPLIGQGTTSPADPEFATLTEEEKENLRRLAEQHPEDTDDSIPVTTAFFVVIHQDGSYGVTQDVTAKFAPDRMATGDDVLAACSVAISDLEAGKTAALTAMQMAQMGQMMAQRQQEQAIQQRLAQDMGFKNR